MADSTSDRGKPIKTLYCVKEIAMSVSGISSSLYNTENVQSGIQQFQQTFRQLGQDLQSGNLSAAQSDFAALQKLQPPGNASSSSQSNSPIAQAFSQLSQDLQSGNLSRCTAGLQYDSAGISEPGWQAAMEPKGIITITAAEAARAKSVSCLTSWARICNPAVYRAHRAHSRPCSRILRDRLAIVDRPRPRPVRAVFR